MSYLLNHLSLPALAGITPVRTLVNIMSLLDLPGPVWPCLFKHLLAAGPTGLAAAVAFEHTCKAVLHRATYTNLQLEKEISDPAHLFWSWLECRLGRISGLTMHVDLEELSWEGLDEAWQHPMSLLARVPGLRLTLSTPNTLPKEDALARAFLQQHGHLIGYLYLNFNISESGHAKTLPSFVPEQCLDVEVTLLCEGGHTIDLSELQPLAGKLSGLRVDGDGNDSVIGVSTLFSFSKLRYLSLVCGNPLAEPWTVLAALTGLQQLSCRFETTGDAAPLSVLTRLTSLCLDSYYITQNSYLTTLQPLIALQQLQVLTLGCFDTTSLHGLSGLSSLRRIDLGDNTSLVSLEGLKSTALTSLSLSELPSITSVEGLLGLQCLQKLCIWGGVGDITSLEPLSQLASLRGLAIEGREQLPSLAGLGITHLKLRRVKSLAGTQSLRSCLKSLSCCRLHSLEGIEVLTGLQKVELEDGDFTSLQPLAMLQHLRELRVVWCSEVVESVLVLPSFDIAGSIEIKDSSVKEVVLAGGVRMAV
jgi:hypothetical protein